MIFFRMKARFRQKSNDSRGRYNVKNHLFSIQLQNISPGCCPHARPGIHRHVTRMGCEIDAHSIHQRLAALALQQRVGRIHGFIPEGNAGHLQGSWIMSLQIESKHRLVKSDCSIHVLEWYLKLPTIFLLRFIASFTTILTMIHRRFSEAMFGHQACIACWAITSGNIAN